MIELGKTIELTYPDSNLIDAIESFRRRRLIVQRVRDLVAEPLLMNEYLRRPMVARSRWLLICRDLADGSIKQFYLGSAKEHSRPGVLRVGLYRPGDRQPYDLIGPAFRPTPSEQRILQRVLAEWSQADLGRLQLRILADDLDIAVA